MTILFDLDGTLLDTGPDFLITLNQMLSMDNLPPIQYSAIRPFINLGTAKMLEIAYGSQADDKLKKRFLDTYLQLNLANTQLFPGVLEMLHSLSQEYSLGLVTNKNTQLTLKALRHFDIQKFFKAIVCGDTLAVKKPNPAPLLLAAQQIRVKPAKCIFIGDAQTANMRTMLVTFGYVPEESIFSCWQADALVNDTTELIKQVRQWT
jgi:2-phosphoglycolate phosphatase